MDLVYSYLLSPRMDRNEKRIKTKTTIEEEQISFNEQKSKVNKTIGGQPHTRLKLKDYLRLNVLKKKNCNSSLKEESQKQLESRKFKKSNRQTISLLKEDIKKDLKVCRDQLLQLEAGLDKMEESIQVRNQSDQIVNLCELHRIIKDDVQNNLQKCLYKVEEQKHDIVLDLLAKTKGYVERQRKKIDSPMRKRRKKIQTLKTDSNE